MDIRPPKIFTLSRLTATPSVQTLTLNIGQQLEAKVIQVNTERQTLTLEISQPPVKLEVTRNLPVEFKSDQILPLVVTKPSPEAEFKLNYPTDTDVIDKSVTAETVDLKSLVLKQLVSKEKISTTQQTPVQTERSVFAEKMLTPLTTLVTAKVLSSTPETIRLKLDMTPFSNFSTTFSNQSAILQQTNPEITFIKQTIKEIDSQIKLIILPQQPLNRPVHVALEPIQNSLPTSTVDTRSKEPDNSQIKPILLPQQPLNRPVHVALEPIQNSLLTSTADTRSVELNLELNNMVTQIAQLRSASAEQIAAALNLSSLDRQDKIKIATALTLSKIPTKGVEKTDGVFVINPAVQSITNTALLTPVIDTRQYSIHQVNTPPETTSQTFATGNSIIQQDPGMFKPGQTIQLEINQHEAMTEFKIINSTGLELKPKQYINAKILQIVGDKIQLLISQEPPPTDNMANPGKILSLSVKQLYIETPKVSDRQPLTEQDLKNLLPTQSLKLQVIKTGVPAEFSLIQTHPAELSQGQLIKTRVIEVSNSQLKLALQIPLSDLTTSQTIPLPRSAIYYLAVDLNSEQTVIGSSSGILDKVNQRTHNPPTGSVFPAPNMVTETILPALTKLQVGQYIKLEVQQSTPELQFRFVENISLNEKKVADITKQLLPVQQPAAEMVNYVVKTLPLLQNNEKISEALKRLAKEILDSISPLKEGLNAKQLETAARRSGIWLESRLAQITAKNKSNVQHDFKVQLLKLKQILKQEIEPKSGSKISTPELDLIKEMLQKTEHSLARIILNQLASLPKDDISRQSWIFDLAFLNKEFSEPVRVEIEREKPSRQDTKKENWSVNITISPPNLGTIHCKLSCIDNMVNTRFWSENPQVANKIYHHLDVLKYKFEQVGIKPGQLSVSQGEPAKQPPSIQLSPDRFDREV